MGDFNINLLNYDKHKPTADFIENVFSYSYIPLITKPTSITNNSATLIYNLFTNNTQPTSKKHVGILYTDISDHLPIYCFETNVKTQNVDRIIRRRLINTQTIATFKQKLHSIDWT